MFVSFNHNDQAAAYMGALFPVFLVGVIMGNSFLLFPAVLFGSFAALGFALMEQARGDVDIVLQALARILQSEPHLKA